MMRTLKGTSNYFSRQDIGAIKDFNDKLAECEYFLGMAIKESERDEFRWQVSAFLNAAYSYLEMSALHAHFAFVDQDGNNLPDSDRIKLLRRHVCVVQKNNKPDYVKTTGLTPLTKRLYEIRRRNTHHFPLDITAAGTDLPNDFRFGSVRGEGESVLLFCWETLELIRAVENDAIA